MCSYCCLESSLYTLDTRPFHQRCFAKIVQSVASFIFNSVFAEQRFNIDEIHLLLACAFVVLRNLYVTQGSFLLEVYKVLGFTLCLRSILALCVSSYMVPGMALSLSFLQLSALLVEKVCSLYCLCTFIKSELSVCFCSIDPLIRKLVLHCLGYYRFILTLEIR